MPLSTGATPNRIQRSPNRVWFAPQRTSTPEPLHCLEIGDPPEWASVVASLQTKLKTTYYFSPPPPLRPTSRSCRRTERPWACSGPGSRSWPSTCLDISYLLRPPESFKKRFDRLVVECTHSTPKWWFSGTPTKPPNPNSLWLFPFCPGITPANN